MPAGNYGRPTTTAQADITGDLVPCRWSKDGWRYANNISKERFFSNQNRHNANGWPIQ